MKKLGFFSIILALFMTLLVASAASAGKIAYDAVPLGFTPLAINNNGTIVGGRMILNSYNFEAIVWSKDRGITSLGTFGDGSAETIDINDQSDILIDVEPASAARYYLVVRANGQQDKIDGFTSVGDSVWLKELNNLDQAVGYIAPRNGDTKGLIWNQQSQATVSMRKSCWFEAINNHGQAVGYGPNLDADPASIASVRPSPMIWTNSGMWSLETPFGTGSVDNINDDGISVGSFDTDPTYSTADSLRPALWNAAGKLYKLAFLDKPGLATFINNSNMIVGFLNSEPVIWLEPRARPIPLTKLVTGIKVTNVYDFNDRCQILAEGQRPDGTRGYFLLQLRGR